MRIFKLLALIAVSVQLALANSPVALVTEIEGGVQSHGRPLELLSYLSKDDLAVVAQGGKVTLSYIKGGLRATVVGPATILLKEGEPALLKGEPSQLSLIKPPKRVGAALPSNLDLGSGGSLRRGELALHLPRKVMPGEQRVEYSARPSFKTFRLVVENSSTFERVFESEAPVNGAFLIPASKLSPGNSYDFLLQGTSEAGGTAETKEESVVVMSGELADNLAELARKVSKAGAAGPESAELLALYLSCGLDLEALRLVERLTSDSEPSARLHSLKKTLRARLQYRT